RAVGRAGNTGQGQTAFIFPAKFVFAHQADPKRTHTYTRTHACTCNPSHTDTHEENIHTGSHTVHDLQCVPIKTAGLERGHLESDRNWDQDHLNLQRAVSLSLSLLPSLTLLSLTLSLSLSLSL